MSPKGKQCLDREKQVTGVPIDCGERGRWRATDKQKKKTEEEPGEAE